MLKCWTAVSYSSLFSRRTQTDTFTRLHHHQDDTNGPLWRVIVPQTTLFRSRSMTLSSVGLSDLVQLGFVRAVQSDICDIWSITADTNSKHWWMLARRNVDVPTISLQLAPSSRGSSSHRPPRPPRHVDVSPETSDRREMWCGVTPALITAAPAAAAVADSLSVAVDVPSRSACSACRLFPPTLIHVPANLADPPGSSVRGRCVPGGRLKRKQVRS